MFIIVESREAGQAVWRVAEYQPEQTVYSYRVVGTYYNALDAELIREARQARADKEREGERND